MNKIDLNNRVSVDGKSHSQKAIERWYVKCVRCKITGNLNNLQFHKSCKQEIQIVNYLKQNIESFLLIDPNDINKSNSNNMIVYTMFQSCKQNKYNKTNKIYNTASQGETLCKLILDAFDYKGFRKTILIKLARILNVKVCPYCNMQYTLVADENSSSLAKFQFDHFFSKQEYPWLSMSLYNLIPSCAECNHGKSTGTLGLKFHPYKSDIYKQFVFRIPNTEDVLYDIQKKDSINIDLIHQNATSRELYEYNQMFHIKTLYQRHGDIAREVFAKAYQYPYWSNPQNYNWVPNYSPMNQLRLYLGTYVRQEEIEKRPMTKFIQDLWEQARGKPIDTEIWLEDE